MGFFYIMGQLFEKKINWVKPNLLTRIEMYLKARAAVKLQDTTAE